MIKTPETLFSPLSFKSCIIDFCNVQQHSGLISLPFHPFIRSGVFHASAEFSFCANGRFSMIQKEGSYIIMPQMIENHIFPHATHSKHTLPLSSRQTSAAIPRLSGQTRAAAPARAQKAADEFARYLLTRNLADETLRAYTYAVRQYFTYYRDITYPNLKLYKIFLLEHYKPQTINQRIRALNAYLDFKKLYPGHLPMVKIQQKTSLDHMISEADYEYLKRCLLRDERYTYYFLIRFMAATGVRVSEVIQFQAEDIFSGYKDIYSKGNKVRRIYIPQSLRTDTLKWLSFLHKSHGPIFLNRFGSPISPGGIRSQLKTIALSYHMTPEMVHPHAFRHRFAKSFIEKCGDISLLADLLGHDSIETTRGYLMKSS